MEMAGPVPELKSQTPATSDAYLVDFERLGPQIYYLKPREVDAVTVSEELNLRQPPDLIVFCSWMGAASRYISKYTKIYQKRFKGVPILLLRQNGPDLFWRPNKWQMENLRPAVSVLSRYVQEKNGQPRFLFHLFSNGGAYTACQLAEAYKLYCSSEDKLLPISALVLDSLPSLPDVWRTHSALSEMLPASLPLRLVGEVVLWSYIFGGRTADFLGLTENALVVLYKKLNEAGGPMMQKSLKRMYIYSQQDKLVPSKQVEAHAREAAALIGTERVLLEDFITSRHVGHVLVDEQRYWNLVEQFWNDHAT